MTIAQGAQFGPYEILSAYAECADCTGTGRPSRYHAAAFTDDAVAQLRQQLDDRMGQQLGY